MSYQSFGTRQDLRWTACSRPRPAIRENWIQTFTRISQILETDFDNAVGMLWQEQQLLRFAAAHLLYFAWEVRPDLNVGGSDMINKPPFNHQNYFGLTHRHIGHHRFVKLRTLRKNRIVRFDVS